MTQNLIGLALTILGLFWAARTVKQWWSSRKVNQISKEDQAIFREVLKNENDIKAVTDKLKSIPNEQEGKTDSQIENFWGSKQ